MEVPSSILGTPTTSKDRRKAAFYDTVLPMSSDLYQKDRLIYLDALRGAAILLVVLFHAYFQWSHLMPYGDRFAAFPLFRYGLLGVQLFFLISGFVIFMTLERCKSFGEFIKKRWLRLFPGMLIATVFIFGTAVYLPERPGGIPNPQDVIPGLTFIHPFFWQMVWPQIQELEGTFWTLYVEVIFYFIFGLAYFWKRDRAWHILVGLAIVGALAKLFGFMGHAPTLVLYLNILGLPYYGWFATGAMAYLYSQNKINGAWVVAGAIFSILSTIGRDGIGASIAMIPITAVFFAPIVFPSFAAWMGRLRPFIFLGYISYPLYLIHENALVGMTIKLGKAQTMIPAFFLPWLPAAFLMIIAYLIARYAEPRLKGWLERGIFGRLSRSR